MNDDAPPDRRTAFRALIQRFLSERCTAKLEKCPDDDPKQLEIKAQFVPETWLADAARRVSQIQAVTHSLKAMHPDARGSNLYCPPVSLQTHFEVGTHALPSSFASDVVGNAAALDVYKFLRQPLFGKSLLDWMRADDDDLRAALSDDPEQAAAWVAAFTGLVDSRGDVASHTRAKQLYWLVGEDPMEDGDYCLLAPLYPSALAHEVYQQITQARFGEESKAARQARREGRDHPHGFADYRGLAVQKLGGTKPQNISQLNSERGGMNYLLASLPPQWQSDSAVTLKGQKSVFSLLERRLEVRQTVKVLRDFLRGQPDPTAETRNTRDALLERLLDELVALAGEIRESRAPGWSAHPDCGLVAEERLWLDPGRAAFDEDFGKDWTFMDWPDVIGLRFGNWLNGQLGGLLPVGEIEARHWQRELLLDERDEGFAHDLHDLRHAHRKTLPTPEAV
jgi:CRISPR-associated protein Csy1